MGQPVSAQTIATGSALFSSIGCATCHNPTPGTTQVSNFVPALSNAPVNAFSDIEIHHMGSGLADNVSQGGAGGDQFRTAPLWGLGQRIFLLHDGRTTNLIAAIEAHAEQWQRSHQRGREFRQPQQHPAAGDAGLPALAVAACWRDAMVSRLLRHPRTARDPGFSRGLGDLDSSSASPLGMTGRWVVGGDARAYIWLGI